jgi:hypothetical protein
MRVAPHAEFQHQRRRPPRASRCSRTALSESLLQPLRGPIRPAPARETTYQPRAGRCPTTRCTAPRRLRARAAHPRRPEAPVVQAPPSNAGGSTALAHASSSGVPPGGNVRRKRAEIAPSEPSRPLSPHNQRASSQAALALAPPRSCVDWRLRAAPPARGGARQACEQLPWAHWQRHAARWPRACRLPCSAAGCFVREAAWRGHRACASCCATGVAAARVPSHSAAQLARCCCAVAARTPRASCGRAGMCAQQRRARGRGAPCTALCLPLRCL